MTALMRHAGRTASMVASRSAPSILRWRCSSCLWSLEVDAIKSSWSSNRGGWIREVVGLLRCSSFRKLYTIRHDTTRHDTTRHDTINPRLLAYYTSSPRAARPRCSSFRKLYTKPYHMIRYDTLRYDTVRFLQDYSRRTQVARRRRGRAAGRFGSFPSAWMRRTCGEGVDTRGGGVAGCVNKCLGAVGHGWACGGRVSASRTRSPRESWSCRFSTWALPLRRAEAPPCRGWPSQRREKETPARGRGCVGGDALAEIVGGNRWRESLAGMGWERVGRSGLEEEGWRELHSGNGRRHLLFQSPNQVLPLGLAQLDRPHDGRDRDRGGPLDVVVVGEIP
jgi:hypothetical protein